MTARRKSSALLLLLVVLLLARPAVLDAHQSLRHSEPGKDARLTAVPSELRLTFNQPADLRLTRVVLTGPAGDTVALAPLTHSPDSTRVVVAAIVGTLGAGTHRVRWVTAGSDGHPTSGEFAFEILDGAAGLAQTPDSSIAADLPAREFAAPARAAFSAESPAYIGVRWLLYLAIVLIVGAVAFRLLVVASVARGESPIPRWLEDAAARAARLGLVGTMLLAVAVPLRLWAQSSAMRGAGLAIDAGRLTTFLGGTPWGWGWLGQAAAVLVLLAGFALARRSHAAGGWVLAATGALAVCMTPGLSGHAVAAPQPALMVAAHTGHVIGAGGWIGALALIMMAGVPAAFRLDGVQRGRAVAALIAAFSPAALAFGALVGATGVAAAWVHLGSLERLWESAYGRVLLIKLGVLALLAAVAFVNWRRVKPRLGDMAGTRTLQRSAALEIALAALVLLVTAVLVAMPIETQAP